MAKNQTWKCCKLKMCKVRSLKTTGMIIFWIFLLSCALKIIISVTSERICLLTHSLLLIESPYNNDLDSFLVLLLSFPLFLSMLFIGWLADTKYGNYPIFRVGCTLSFFSSIIECALTLYEENAVDITYSIKILLLILNVSNYIIAAICFFSCIVSFQLGLDQMPDASSDNVKTFIVCHFTSVVVGLFMGRFFRLPLFTKILNYDEQLQSLTPAVCTSLALCLDFCFSSKLLVMERKSYQTFSAIYRVLKFATMHKSPVNRSALTYWEENIPSRLDLAKSRYGGPFSTEYVENVKTFFKLLLMFFPILPSMGVLGYLLAASSDVLDKNARSIFTEIYSFVPIVFIVFTVMLNEILPLSWSRCKQVSILQRLSLAMFFSIILCLSGLLWQIICLQFNTCYTIELYFHILLLTCLYVIVFFYGVGSCEFICAQSPHNMRALLLGYGVTIVVGCIGIGYGSYHLVAKFCKTDYCNIVHFCIALVMSLIGFVVNFEFAKRFVLRRRDDIEHVHHWVETYYDKILP